MLVYATPPSPPPVRVSPWVRTLHEFVAHDGSRWELSNWRSGVFLTGEGTEGLHLPKETAWLQPQSPVAHGQVYTGGSIDARPVFWPVYLYADAGSDAFRQLDSAFWSCLFPGRVGTWRVTTTGGTRELTVRPDDNSGHVYPKDPHMFGWAKYGIALVADSPFWRDTSVVERAWSTAVPVGFYGGAAIGSPSPGAAPFVVSEGSTLGTAQLDNPGDVDAWPVWSVKATSGSVSDIRLGVDGREVVFPGPIATGQTLSINTDPLDQQAFLDGVNVTDQLTGWGFAPVPHGGLAPLSLSMTGVGEVKASITPLYYRAW